MAVREVIFRGKCTANGEWVYGDLLNVGVDYDYAIRTYGGREHGQVNAVNEKTVGQYTGLTDKKGKKVFEGDIVKNEYRKGQYQYFKIVYDTRFYCWQVENKYGMLGFLYNVIGDLEVIGNIYDNPKLLEVK